MADKKDADYYGFGDMDLEDDPDLTPGSTRSTKREVQGEKAPGFVESAEAAAAPGIKQAKEGWSNVSGADALRGAGRMAVGGIMQSNPVTAGIPGLGVNVAEDAIVALADRLGYGDKVRAAFGVSADDPGTMSRIAETGGKMAQGLVDLGADYTKRKFAIGDTKAVNTPAVLGASLGGTVGGVARGADPTRVGGLSREDPAGQVLAAGDAVGMAAGGLGAGAAAARGLTRKMIPGTRPFVSSGAQGGPGAVAAGARKIDDTIAAAGGEKAILAAEKFTPEELQALRNQAALEKMEAISVLNPPKKAARQNLERRMAQRDLAPDEIPEGFSGDLSGGTDWGMSLEPPPNASMVSSIGTGGARPGNVKGWSVPEVPDAPKTSMSEVPAPVTGVHKPAGVDLDFGTPTDYGIDIGPLAQANQRLMDAEDVMSAVGRHEAAMAATGGKSLAELQADLARLKAMGGTSPVAVPGMAGPFGRKPGSSAVGARLHELGDATMQASPKWGRVAKAVGALDADVPLAFKSAVGAGAGAAAGAGAGPLGMVAGGLAGAAAPVGLAAVKSLVRNPAAFEGAMTQLVALGKVAPGMTLTAETAQAIGNAAEQDGEIMSILKQYGVVQ